MELHGPLGGTASADLAAHIADTTDAHDASAISILDAANDFTATNVEDALAELQAADEADEAALAAHLADGTDAHDASAISVDSTTLVGTGTDVQAVFEELDNSIADHLADAVDAHDASAISFTPNGSIAATDVQAAIQEVRDEAAGSALTVKEDGAVVDATVNAIDFLGADFDVTESPEDEVNVVISAAIARQSALDAHLNDTVDAHDASAISFTPNGSIAATDVQAAIQEVRDEAGSGASLTVKEDGSVVDATVTTIDFLGADFDVSESPEDEVNVVISAAIARQSALDAHTGDTSDAHDASAISVADAGGYFADAEVEAVLQSLGLTRYDGWVPCDETLTYASASTYTVSGDRTAKYSKGTRLNLTQTTPKYFVVVGAVHAAGTTTVTVTGGDDYSLANAAITSPFYSYAASPQGFPGWFSYTPTLGGSTSSSSTCRFSVVGRACTFAMVVSGTSNATTKTITLPITAATVSGMQWIFGMTVKNNGAVLATPGEIVIDSADTTADLYKDTAAAAWTASGTWFAIGTVIYEI